MKRKIVDEKLIKSWQWRCFLIKTTKKDGSNNVKNLLRPSAILNNENDDKDYVIW